MHEAVKDFFAVAQADEFAHVDHDFFEEIDKDHGRLEIRRYWITEELRTLPDTELWTGLRSIGLVECRCLVGDTETVEQRFFLNAIPADAARFAHAVRGHWGVENRLHWRLDVVFREDANRIRKGHAPAIMTAIRHLCLNLFEQEPSSRRLAQKQRQAAWDDDYLFVNMKLYTRRMRFCSSERVTPARRAARERLSSWVIGYAPSWSGRGKV